MREAHTMTDPTEEPINFSNSQRQPQGDGDLLDLGDAELIAIAVHPVPLLAAVRLGAAQNFTSVSDYVRRALIAQLKLDGIDPYEARPAASPAGDRRVNA
jgi:hypothetical protein